MLKKAQRLHRDTDFTNVLKNGKRHYFGGVLLYCIDNNEDVTRFGFIVSKKFSQKATERNRQRRILISALKTYLPNIASGKDIVVSYTNRGKVLTYKKALDALFELLNHFNLIIK